MRYADQPIMEQQYGVVVVDMAEREEVLKIDRPVSRVRLGITVETWRKQRAVADQWMLGQAPHDRCVLRSLLDVVDE